MRNLWSQLNRPLVVLLIGLLLWPLVSAWKQRLVVHSAADAVFAELNRAEGQMNDQAKKSGIKTLVESFVSQFVGGFSAAFDKMGEDKESKLADYEAVLKQVAVNEVKAVPSQFGGRERIVGVIHNGSAQTISDVHLNLMMYGADGHLIDAASSSQNDIKVILPGQDVGFTVDHDLDDSSARQNGDDESDQANTGADPAEARKAAAQAKKAAQDARQAAENARRAVKVTAQVVSFDVEKAKGKGK